MAAVERFKCLRLHASSPAERASTQSSIKLNPARTDYRTSVFPRCECFSSTSTCFKMRSNIRMKQLRFISSSSQSKSIVFPLGCPKFLKGLWKGLRIGLRNGLWKGLGNGLSMLCWTLRPGSEAMLTWRHKKSTCPKTVKHLSTLISIQNCIKWKKLWQPYYSLL